MNTNIHIQNPVVPAEWLYNNLKAKNLVVLDGTINKAFKNVPKTILKARYFDIKNKFSDVLNAFPNAFPSREQFQREARILGLNNNSAIVVCDDKGIYSSARVWWLFKAFGYDNIAVLNGGLPAWLEGKYPIGNMTKYDGEKGNFVAKPRQGFVKYFEDMVIASKNKAYQIIDARSASRFKCLEPEPRAGLRSGTIPNSKNIPFKSLLNNKGLLKPKEDLKDLLSKAIKNDDNVIFSCGSGITACVLALSATISGYKNIAVYDGSWTEWGTLMKS